MCFRFLLVPKQESILIRVRPLNYVVVSRDQHGLIERQSSKAGRVLNLGAFCWVCISKQWRTSCQRKEKSTFGRSDYGRQSFQASKKSGLSGRAYCRAKGISYTAFATRRRRLTNSTDVGSKPGSTHRVDFAPVALKSPPPEPSW